MPEETNKRQRVSKACEQCRKKKVKCDGISPVCGNCITLNLTCTYKESTKKRGPPKGYIEAIEGRLHRLEALLGSIIEEDDPRSQAIMAELNAPLQTAYGELVRPRPSRKDNQYDEHTLHSTEFHDHHTHQTSLHDGSHHSPDTDSENMNDNLGNLSMDESGQLRYYGKSSGFYMLRGSENFQNGAFHFNSKGIRTKLDSEKGLPNTLAVDPFELPPPDLSKHLLDLYFTHFYPLLPLLHKKSFLQKLDSDHPPPPLLLNAIYAVASRISPDIRVRTDPTQRDTAGDIFLERARILLDFEWDDFQVSTVQSLLLLSSHQNGALKNIRGWLYSGLAFRMCQNLGLNRNCDSWNLSDAEKEERKRVFYCSFVLDRLTCAMHGRSPMIDDRDLDAPYPSEVDEDDRHNKPTIMEDFHQLIKLCEIIGDILCQVYMVKGRRKLSVMASPDNVIAKLDKALNQWMTKLPPSVQYRPPNTRMGKKAPAPKLELCQIHMLFYTSLILLHRPFIPGYNQTTTPSVFPSASICTFAANKILDIVECLMAEGKLKNVNNYALYFMFTAGIIFINDALSTDSMFAFEAKISINKIIRAMDEIETTWLTSARHCNILAELAGLRELNLKNIDESHSRKAKPEQSKYAPPMAITVPNSPIISNDHTLSPPEYRNPIDTERGVEHRLPDYLTQYGGYKPIERTRSPNQFNTSSSNSVDYSTHSSPSSHKTEAMDIGQDRPFDSIGTAFWGIPTSFDIDEWNNYFSHQQGQANERMAYPIINTSQHMNTNTTNNTHNNNNNNYSSSSNNNYHNLNNGNNHRNNNRSNNNNHSYTFMPTRPPTAGRNPHW